MAPVPGMFLVIAGENFSRIPEENIVHFNGVQAHVTSATSTTLDTTIPAGSTTGPITVSVNGQTATSEIFKVYGRGTVTNITPICGPIGTTISIHGSGFEPNISDNTVFFVGAEARGKIIEASSDKLRVTVPDELEISDGVIWELVVVLATENKSSNLPSSRALFSISEFTLDGFSPTTISRAAGTPITITCAGVSKPSSAFVGIFFTAADGTKVEAEYVSLTDTQIVMKVPSNAVTGPIFAKHIADFGPKFISFPENLTITE
jgi:hypothetical protein